MNGANHPPRLFYTMPTVIIQNKNHPLSTPLQVKYCDRFFCRLRGLMFRNHLQPDEGLLLVQSHDSRFDSAIHMFFVFTDLAVVWINTNRIVVDAILARPWRPAYLPRDHARFILEIHPERLGEFQIGDLIDFLHV